jgi:hypothetical protein
MKLKLLPMLAGAISTVALTLTSLTAFAQTPSPQTPAPQTQTRPRPRIVFSREQQAKFEEIQKNTIDKIEAVLTPPQKTQFAAGRESGKGLAAIENLTDPQKSQIRTILQGFNSQIGELLTPEQKQQIQQNQPSQ